MKKKSSFGKPDRTIILPKNNKFVNNRRSNRDRKNLIVDLICPIKQVG